jgi:stringent starvation protein B
MATPLPDKHELMLKLLEHGSVFMHLDPRREGVAVPKHLRDRPQLVLQIGLNFPIPIRDLEIDGEGVRCTLSFNRSPFYCIVPWSSVYALVGDDGQVTVWPGDLPAELVPPTEPSAPQAVRAKKPKDKSTKKPRITPTLVSDTTLDSVTSSERRTQPPLALAASEPSSSPSSGDASEHEGPPKKFTRSGREVPPWLRVVK